MARRRRVLAVGFVAAFVVVACWALLASPGIAQADPCGRMHVLASAKPATDGGLAFQDGPAIAGWFTEAPRQDGASQGGASQRDGSRVQRVPVEPVSLRAPPLA